MFLSMGVIFFIDQLVYIKHDPSMATAALFSEILGQSADFHENYDCFPP